MTQQTQRSAYLTEQDDGITDELAEIVAGLAEPQKTISPKYFYDKRGSKLFDQICNLPEYYPTRTELAIMKAFAGQMAELVGPQASLSGRIHRAAADDDHRAGPLRPHQGDVVALAVLARSARQADQ